MSTIVDNLFSNNQNEQEAAFANAVNLIAQGRWTEDIGSGCNGFHFVAFAPEKALNAALPDWQERLKQVIDTAGAEAFDRPNDNSPDIKIPGYIEGGDGIPAFNSDTPLGIALWKKNEAAARIFLKEGADVYHKNATGNTILHLAAASNVLVEEICQQTMRRAFEAKTHAGQTPEEQAMQHGNEEAAQIIGNYYSAAQDIIARRMNIGGNSGLQR